jgi:hypothetical protein
LLIRIVEVTEILCTPAKFTLGASL